jgi:hypothetical protein
VTRTDWRDFYLVKDELRLFTDADVDAAETSVGVQLADGYRELMTTLGAGTISNDLRVFPPTELANKQALLREVVAQAWFFDEPDEELTPNYALASTFIADSDVGDLIIFHPGTGRMHVLPRDEDRTYAVGRDLHDVVEWWLDSGVLWRPSPFRFFESWVGPTEAANGVGNRAGFARVSAAVRSLGVHDVEVTGADEDGRTDSRTFFLKAIGGSLSITDSRVTDLHVHFRYQADRSPEVRAQLRESAIAAGVSFGKPWSMTP